MGVHLIVSERTQVMRFKTSVFSLFVVAGFATIGFGMLTRRAEAVQRKPPAEDAAATIAQLEARLKQLEGLVPNQPTVMTHVAYHFTNLWFAAERQNWPLAEYYLGEVRSNLKWAVRVRPVRPGPSGEVNVAGIAEAVDNTELTELQKAIHGKQPKAFVRAYDETLMACAACHQAIGKPYLRPQRPGSPETQVINFDPGGR
jgi:hypothetical protein